MVCIMMTKKERLEFDPSGTIAMFIAAALQHPNPPCNSAHRRRVSTIFVSQHKNKFDRVVVYCTLAATNLVNESWAENGEDGEPTPEFIEKCFVHDAEMYRMCYRKMLFLAPQYRDMTLATPDYCYLLFDTKAELDAWLIDKHEHAKEANGCRPGLLENWHVNNIDELRVKLHKVYDRGRQW